MEGGVDDFEGVLALDERRVEREGGQAVHVGLVDVGPHGNDTAAFGFRNRLVVFARNGVDALDDRRGVGFHDLAAVLEIHLVAVVFRRVVARSEVDARLRADVADGEGEFRRRARALEEVGVAAEVRDDFRGEFREFAREKAGVVAEADGWLARRAVFGMVVLDVVNESLGGTADVVGIHGVRAGAGELGPAERLGFAPLGLGDDGADSFAAQAAGAEREGAEKAVVQFRPVLFRDEFLDRGFVDGGGRAGEEFGDV